MAEDDWASFREKPATKSDDPWADFRVPNATVAPSSALDFFKSIPRGIASALTSTASAMGQAAQTEMGEAPNVPGAHESRDILEREITGPLHKPETRAGRFGETIGEFVGNPASYVMPGGLASKVVTATIAGAGSEAGGQLTEGTAAEPWARAAGALIASKPGRNTSVREALADELAGRLEPGSIKPGTAAAEFKIPLTTGEATKNFDKIQYEQAALKNAYGPRAQKEAEAFFNTRWDAAQEALKRQKAELDPFNQTITHGPVASAEMASESLVQAASARKKAYEARYDEFADLPGVIHAGAFEGIAQKIKGKLSLRDSPVIVDDKTTPISYNALRDIETHIDRIKVQNKADPFGAPNQENIVGVNLKGVDQTRKRLITFAGDTTAGSADNRAMKAIIRAFDDNVEEAVSNGLFSGSDRALAALKEARAGYSSYQRTFKPKRNDGGVGAVIDKIVHRDEGAGATANEVANWLYGAAGTGASGLSTRVAMRVRDVIGPQSPEWSAIRQGMFERLTQSAEGKDAFGAQKVSQRIFEFVNGSGRSTAEVMFTPSERAQMVRLGKAFKEMVPMSGTVNTSGSAYVGSSIIRNTVDALSHFIKFPGLGWITRIGQGVLKDRAQGKKIRSSLYGEPPIPARAYRVTPAVQSLPHSETFSETDDQRRRLAEKGFAHGGRAEGDAKSTKAQAHYRLGGKGKTCGGCQMFRPPHGCTSVNGKVSKIGLCDYFARKAATFAEGGEVAEDEPFDEAAEAQAAREAAAARIMQSARPPGGRKEGAFSHVLNNIAPHVAEGITDFVATPGNRARGTTPELPGIWTEEDQFRANQAADKPYEWGPATAAGMVSAPSAMSKAMPANALGSFAGRGAKTADHAALAQAEAMAAKGATPESIWNDTGWFRGKDDKWRFEIPDSPSTMWMGDWPTAGSKLKHDDLYAAYPDLAGVKLDYRMPGEGGVYSRPHVGNPEEIGMPASSIPMSQEKNLLLHELQHAIQQREGFATGSYPGRHLLSSDMHRKLSEEGVKDFYHEAYRRLAGEVESRNVARRAWTHPAELKKNPPWTSEDYPRDLQSVIYPPPNFGSGGRLPDYLANTMRKYAEGGEVTADETDPFEIAARRTREAARPPGGRYEGALTRAIDTAVEKAWPAMTRTAQIPRDAMAGRYVVQPETPGIWTEGDQFSADHAARQRIYDAMALSAYGTGARGTALKNMVPDMLPSVIGKMHQRDLMRGHRGARERNPEASGKGSFAEGGKATSPARFEGDLRKHQYSRLPPSGNIEDRRPEGGGDPTRWRYIKDRHQDAADIQALRAERMLPKDFGW